PVRPAGARRIRAGSGERATDGDIRGRAVREPHTAGHRALRSGRVDSTWRIGGGGDGTLVRVSWERWARAERAEIAAADRWRTIRELDSGGPVAHLDGCEVVSFASNDYFGLSQHPAVLAAAHEAIERWGTGAGSARLIAGSRPVHSELERELADWKGAERALLFPTGFAANLGVLSVVGGPDVTII